MKNRILSAVLAVLLVLSMVSVFTVSSVAAEETNVTFTIGHAYGEAGTTVLVPIYVSADKLADEVVGIRNWEVTFKVSQNGVVNEQTTVYYPDENSASYPYVNTSGGVYKLGVSAASGRFYGLADQVTAVGGYKVADLAIEVPADATGSVTIEGVTVHVLNGQHPVVGEDGKTTYVNHEYADTTTVVNGSITIVEGETAPAPVVGEGGTYVVPSMIDGKIVTSLINGNGETEEEYYILQGSFDTLYVPATVTSLAEAFDWMESIPTTYILKNTESNLGEIKYGTTTAPNVVWTNKKVLDTDTSLFAQHSALSNMNKKKLKVNNILAAPSFTYENGTVTVVGIIAVDDLEYNDVTISVDFGEGRVFTSNSKAVGKAITGVNAEGGVYYYALQITGVPEAALANATAVMYGTTPDSTGTAIAVVSDTATYGA